MWPQVPYLAVIQEQHEPVGLLNTRHQEGTSV